MTNLIARLPRPMARWTRLLGLAAVVGVLSGLATAALEYGLHEGSKYLVGRFTQLGQAGILTFRPELLLLPAGGGLLAGLVIFWLCPRLGGHGTDLLIRAFHRKGGVLHLRGPATNAVAAIGVISCGGSAGPEGPVAALGAAIGSALSGAFALTPKERRIMLVAGCGAGIGAIFQCPLGGALFAASVLYREPDYETDAMVPTFVASVIGYSVYMVFWGYGVHLLQGAEKLVFSSPRELVPYAVLGPLCGLVAILLRACFRCVQGMPVSAVRRVRWLAPAFGGLATGAVACALPQVMDGQYVFIQNAMDGNFLGGFQQHAWWFWAALFGAVAIAKCVATALTVGSGAPGGVLGPAVFIGGAVGACLGSVLSAVAPDAFTTDPENLRRALIPVAMAGVLSASMRVPLAALVMVTEMTGSYGLIVPLMLVCVSAYVVGRRWGLSDVQVRSSAESPAHAGDLVVHLLETKHVEDVLRRDWPEIIKPDTSFRELIERVEPGSQPAFAVVDEGQILGLISTPEIRQAMDEVGLHEFLIAGDLMASDPPTVRRCDDLYMALTLMARANQVLLPVVANEDHRRFTGVVTRTDIHAELRRQLDDMRRHLVLEHEGLAAIDQEATLYELVTGASAGRTDSMQRLLVPLQAVGRSLRESDFRRRFGVQVIAIEQSDGSIECPPDADAPLKTNQRLLAIGSENHVDPEGDANAPTDPENPI